MPESAFENVAFFAKFNYTFFSLSFQDSYNKKVQSNQYSPTNPIWNRNIFVRFGDFPPTLLSEAPLDVAIFWAGEIGASACKTMVKAKVISECRNFGTSETKHCYQ